VALGEEEILDPADIQKLIDGLRELSKLTSDPEVIAQIEYFIHILEGWLKTPPGAAVAGKVLQEMLRYFLKLRIPISEATKRAYTVLIDKVVPGITRLIILGGEEVATFLGLELGGSALAAGASVLIAIAAVALLGYSIYKTASAPSLTLVTGPSCGTQNAATGLGPVSDWGVIENQRGLFDNVMAQAQKKCDAYKANCTGKCTLPAVCKPNVSLQDFDISDYWVYRTVTFSKFNCTCECL
jgi:hypothetical protein